MMAMRKTLDERARKKALDAIFNRFDFNQNGAVQCRRSGNMYSHLGNDFRENIHQRLPGGAGDAGDQGDGGGDEGAGPVCRQ